MADLSPAAVKKSIHSSGKLAIPSDRIIKPKPTLLGSSNILLMISIF